MGPMLVAMLVGMFYLVALFSAFVSILPITYALVCWSDQRRWSTVFIAVCATIGMLCSTAVGFRNQDNIIGAMILRPGDLLGYASWAVIGYAWSASAASLLSFVFHSLRVSTKHAHSAL